MREDLDYAETRWSRTYGGKEIEFVVWKDDLTFPNAKVSEISYDSKGNGHIVFEEVDPNIIAGLPFDVQLLVRNEYGTLMTKRVLDVIGRDMFAPGKLVEILCTPLLGSWAKVDE